MPYTAANNRNVVLDIMKGIGILLMIAGHCDLLPAAFIKWIFTFHMPLFFIISGYLFKPNPDFKRFREKNTRRLLYPYLLTSLILILVFLYSAIKNSDKALCLHQCLSLLFPTGIFPEWMTEYLGWANSSVLWFLVALFWCRALTNRLECMGLPLWLIILLGAACAFIGRYLITLPFALMQGASAMVFYAIGYWCSRHKIQWYHTVICLACWIIAFLFSNLDMRICLYNLYPVDVAGACGGTLFIYFISSILSRQKNAVTKCLTTLFAWCGRLSLAILCIHAIIYPAHPFSVLHIDSAWYSQLLLQTFTPLVIAFFFTKIPFTRRVFGIEGYSYLLSNNPT